MPFLKASTPRSRNFLEIPLPRITSSPLLRSEGDLLGRELGEGLGEILGETLNEELGEGLDELLGEGLGEEPGLITFSNTIPTTATNTPPAISIFFLPIGGPEELLPLRTCEQPG